MAHDVTTGELDRRMRDHEQRTAAEHQRIHDRISRVSADSVQIDVHEQIEKDRSRELSVLERRVESLEAKPGLTWGRAAAAATVIVGIIGLLIQAYSTVKGIK